jgi:hypothetical protein
MEPVEKLFRVVYRNGRPVMPSVLSGQVPESATTRRFINAAYDVVKVSSSLPRDLMACNLALYANKEACDARASLPVSNRTELQHLGEDEDDPLVVEVPQVWYELVAADSGATLDSHWVPLTGEYSVDDLRNAVVERSRGMLPGCRSRHFMVYKDGDQEPLKGSEMLAGLGVTKSSSLTVKWRQLTPTTWMPNKRPADEQTLADEVSKRLKNEPRFTLAENTENLEFAQPYQQTAEKLKNTKQVGQVIEAIKLIRGAGRPTPFIVLESSSGMGKMQMAFNLMARCGMEVFYFICEAGSEVMQDVYTTFSDRSAAFLRCVEMDLPKVGGASVREIASEPNLYAYGFIWALLSRADTFEGQRTRADVENARKEREMREETDFLFFLDEFPLLKHHSENRLQFIRNVFRSFGFTVILSSTNGTTRNLIQSGQNSRTSDKSRLWCIVLPTLPPFECPPIDTSRDLQVIMEHSRHLFAKMALDFIDKAESTVDPHTDLVGYLDEMAGDLGQRCVTLKKRSEWFRYGQVRLFLAADYVADGDSVLINKHYAVLHDGEMFRLSFASGDGRALFREKPVAPHERITLTAPEGSGDTDKADMVKNDEEWSWVCRIKFPDLDMDALMYLSLMGGKHFQPLVDADGMPISFYRAYRIAEAAGGAILRPQNTKQSGNDGMRLEAVAAGSIVMASHRNGFAGFDFEGFFGALLYELDMQSSPGVRVKFSDEAADILSPLTVPFLAPPNCQWPAFLKSTQLNLGDIVRSPNSDMLDASLLDGKISVECKDYRSRPISSEKMEGILQRAARPEVAVHLVVTTSLQDKYFGSNSKPFTTTKVFQDVRRTRFYRIGISTGGLSTDDTGKQWRDDIYPVECMSSACRDTPVERVVIFLETTGVSK